MASLSVHVIDSSGKKYQVNIPENAAIDRIITILLERLGTPPVDGSGKAIAYVLLHQRTGKLLCGDNSISAEAVAAGDTLQFVRAHQTEATSNAASTGTARPAPQVPNCTVTKEIETKPQKLRGRQALRHPASLAIASCLVFLFGYLVSHNGRATGKSTTAPTLHESHYAPEPAKSAEDLRCERVENATHAAWNESASFEANSDSTIRRYDTSSAVTLLRYYKNLHSDEIDREFNVWIEELVDASSAVISIQNDRSAQLQAADQKGNELGDNLSEQAKRAAEARGTDDTDKFLRGVLAQGATKVLSGIGTEAYKQKLNDDHDQLLQNALSRLRTCHAKRAKMHDILFARYQWR